MLNYAYAVLESQVRIATVAQGLDTRIGYLHVSRSGRASLVYDLMEPLRPLVDRLLLGFVLLHTFSPNDFVIQTEGVCRLHPQLARQVAKQGLSETVVEGLVAQVQTNLSESATSLSTPLQ
jgi:CRISPR-associated protein Cas1